MNAHPRVTFRFLARNSLSNKGEISVGVGAPRDKVSEPAIRADIRILAKMHAAPQLGCDFDLVRLRPIGTMTKAYMAEPTQ